MIKRFNRLAIKLPKPTTVDPNAAAHPVARAMIGYLLVRGGVHVVAYAKALEVATGADVTKLIPIPSLDNKDFNETRKYEEKGLHPVLYRFSDDDYKDLEQIWKGSHLLALKCSCMKKSSFPYWDCCSFAFLLLRYPLTQSPSKHLKPHHNLDAPSFRSNTPHNAQYRSHLQ
jgi:hypothetical protein